MAKKSAKNPTADSTAIAVLENQIPVRYVAPVDKSQWRHLGDNLYDIPVNQFTPHPENSSIFKNSYKENVMLENSIKIQGVLMPLIANLREDGELRVVSGHRRLSVAEKHGIEYLRTQVRFCNETEELLLLFASNVSRNMQDAAKVRFFKIVQQSMCQISQDDENEDSYEPELIDEALKSCLLELHKDIDINSLTKYEFIQLVTGFTEYEQKVLVRVCSEKYRERTINKIREIKNMRKKADEIKEMWEELEYSVLHGAISLAEVDKDVVALNKVIQKALQGKTVKEKPMQQPKQPKQKAEKITLQNDEKDTFTVSDFTDFVNEYVEENYDKILDDMRITFDDMEAWEHGQSLFRDHLMLFVKKLGERL